MGGPIVFASVLLWVNVHGYVTKEPPEAPPTDLTFMAFLTSFENDVHGVVCSGSIIHESFILTAANCFYTDQGEPISYQHKVLIDTNYKDIEKLIPFPRYFIHTWENDIGLIKLMEKLQYGPTVSRTFLAQSDHIKVHSMAYTTCWRMDQKDKISNLQAEAVRIAPRRHCGRRPFYGRYITKKMLCAAASYNCTVDSGAPLLVGGRLAGVASRAGGRHAVFTRVPRLRWWITRTVYAGRLEEYVASYMF